MRSHVASALFIGLLLALTCGPAAAKPKKAKEKDKPAAAEPATPPPEATDLQKLEEELKAVKAKLEQNKQRLATMRQAPIGGPAAGPAPLVIVHRNEMSAMFRPIRFVYLLDDVQIFSANVDEAQLKGKELAIWQGSIKPGKHQLRVELVYQGSGHGVFAYLNEYQFSATGTHSFEASDDRTLQLKVVGVEKGDRSAKPKDRAAVEFRPILSSATPRAPTPASDVKPEAKPEAKPATKTGSTNEVMQPSF